MRREYLFMIIAGFFWGSGHPVIRSILTSSNPHMDSVQIAFLSTLISSLVLLVFVLLFRHSPPRLEWSYDVFLLAGLAGGLQFGLYPLLSYTALAFIPPSTNAMLVNAAPLFVALLSIFILSERLTGLGYLGLLGAFIGIVLLVQGLSVTTPSGVFPGAFLSISGALITSFYSIIGRKLMRTHEPILVSTVGAVFGTLILTVICFLTSRLNELLWINTTHLYLVIYWAVAQAFGSLLFFAAMRRLEAPRASVFMFMSPLTATLLSVAFLDERITPQFIAGSILIITGITITQRRYLSKTKN